MTVFVKKPWPLYLMALWSFFGIGSFLSSASRSIFSQHETLLPITTLLALIIAIMLAYFLCKFNRKALVIFAVLAALLAASQILNMANILLTQGYNPIILFLLYYIVPSATLAPLAISNKYRELSVKYIKQQQQENMRKASLKALKR